MHLSENRPSSDEPDRLASPGAITRRRVVVAVTMVVGTALLGAAFATAPGSPWFTALALAVAAVWIGGSLASGPIPLGPSLGSAGRGSAGRGRVVPGAVLVAVALYGAFAGAALLAHHIPVLASALRHVLTTADRGSLGVILALAVVSAAGEELFFRGAIYAAVDRRPVWWTTLTYVLVTAVTGNVALVVAAVAVGLVTARERRSTEGVLAPVVTHAVWSTLMILALPR